MNLQTTISNTQKYKKRIDAWRGLNMTDSARDGEMTLIRNFTTDDYPTIKARKPRSVIPGYAGKNITDVFNANGHLVVVADGTLYYDGEAIMELGTGKKQFALVNTQLVIWPDKIVLDLNDGNASQMEAYVIGTANIAEDGGNVAFTPGGAAQHGTWVNTDSYIDGYGYLEYYMWIYTGLEWTEGPGFSWESRTWLRIVDHVNIGDRFIPIQSGGLYTPRRAVGNYDYDDTSGSVYGIILAKETKSLNYNVDVLTTLTYAIYDAAGGAAVLTETFENGETVRLEGFTLKVNNKKAITLDGVTNTLLSFPEGSLVSSAYYYDVDEPVAPGKTWLTWSHEEGGVSVVTDAGCVMLKRTLRPGEQIFITGGEVTHNDVLNYDYIDTTDCQAFVYDPETRTLEELEYTTDSSTYSAQLDCEIILPDAENENVVVRREIPDLDFICEHENRLWGVSNEETETIYNTLTGEYNEVKSRVLFGSALGKPKNFYEYKGVSTDAYAVAVGGNGDFTAICSYSGAVLAWKEDQLCKLTGSYPAEYYLRTYKYEGVAAGSEFSLQTINQILYYLSPEGIMAYSGTVPQLIGEQLGLKKLANCISGRGRTHYYISAEHENGTWLNAVYDVVHGLWSVEEEIRIRSMDRFGNHCYAVIGTDLYKMEDDTASESITWEAELAYMDEGTFQHKRYLTVSLEVEVDEDASFTLLYKDEMDQDWKMAQLAWQPIRGERIRRYVIDTRRSARLYIKLEGTGHIKLHALEREYSIEAER